MDDSNDVMGPVSYLIVEFPDNKMTGDGFDEFVKLVDHGIVRLLDLLFVSCAADGTTTVVEIGDIDGDGSLDLAIFEGASSGLLDAEDIADAGRAIAPGSSAAILLFENRWATAFVNGLRRGNAQLVAAGYIPQDALLASLDATER
jgi:hypothetical protein